MKILSLVLDPKIFFLLVAFLLIQLWFTKGLLFGGTEVGIPTYTPEKTLGQIIWLWWEALGPGASFPNVAASIPLYFFMAILERLGLGAIEIQKVLFFIIIYLQGLGAGLVFKLVSKSGKLQLLAGLFYIFNPFMMIFVWHRFIYANFILSASLPFFIYFYLKLLESGKIKFIFLFLLTSLLSSYMFSSIAPGITVWVAILICFLTATILNRNNLEKITRLSVLTIILLISWTLTNLWWIYPLINTRNVLSVFSSRGNVETLISLSSQSTINYVIRGINPYFLFFQKDWGDIYQTFLFRSLSWIPLLFILFSLLKRDNKGKIWYMIMLFLVGIFVAKGGAEPLGRVTAWFYANIFILGAIRNPFEKLGLLVILPASILATLGVKNFWSLSIGIYPKFVSRIFLKLLVMVLIVGYGVYIWPMFSDKLFGSEKYPPFFTLPEDYPKVSEFLQKEVEADSGKILHLPITEGDSATYRWKYTYNGVELGSHLFPGSSISRFLYISFIDQLLEETARIFHTKDYYLQKRVLSIFGVKYIVLNKNLDWYSRNIDKPDFIEKILDESPDLKVIEETENLKIYKFVSRGNTSIFAADNITLISGSLPRGSRLDYIFETLNKEGAVFIQRGRDQQIPQELLKREVIFPIRIIDTRLEDVKNLDFIIPRPFVKHLPDVFYYPLITLKEKIELLLAPAYEKPMKLAFFTQKRLIELKLLWEQHKEAEFNRSLHRYKDSLDQVINEIKKLPDEELDLIDKITLKITFNEEKEILENLAYEVSDQEFKELINESIEKIINFRKDKGFQPYYKYDKEQGVSDNSITTHIYQFLISQETKAEVILNIPNPKFYDIENNKKIKFFLDGESKEVKAWGKSPFLFSLGDIILKPGIHEIALSFPDKTGEVRTTGFIKMNGIVELDKKEDNLIKITTSKENSWVEYPIESYDPNKTYVIGFFYRVIRGAPPQIQFWQDSDILAKNNEPKITRGLGDDLYDFDWKYFELSFTTNSIASIRLDRNAIKPTIRIFIPFWNNCEGANFRNIKLCKNPEFKKAYNKLSAVEIRDVKIRELFTGGVFLDSVGGNKYIKKDLNFKKISPIEYLVETENSDTQYSYVVLNEGFHTGWKIVLDSNIQLNENSHFLTNRYANGWLIDKQGKLSFKIKFIPQEYLYQGVTVSIASFMALSILVVIRILIKRKMNRKNE